MNWKYWRDWGGITLGAGALLTAMLLRLMPSAAESLYGSGVGPWIGLATARLSGLLPIALSEWMIGCLILVELGWAIVGFRALRRSELPRIGLALRGLRRVIGHAGIVLFLFQLLWAFHYARPPLETRWQLPSPTDAAATEKLLARLCYQLIDATNDAYVELHGTKDSGSPTAQPDIDRLHAALEDKWVDLATARELGMAVAKRRPRPKSPAISPLMDRLGLSGFFFPWSGEANVNAGLPGISYAHAVAHEKAHQRGIAPEDEANFLAVLIGAQCNDPTARYAALLFAQRQILRALLRTKGEAASELLSRRHGGVQRDVDDQRAYWDRHRGVATDLARRSNHLYLRSNRVEGGIASYGGSLGLLLAYLHDGNLSRLEEFD